MTKWTYDAEVDCAYIEIDSRQPGFVRTVDLNGIHVMMDVDHKGNVLGIELIGHGGLVESLHLNDWLKKEPNTP
jgi:uncharacterized protein YuzE